MSLRNTSFENWRLSRIEEELERLSHSSQDTSADDGSCSPRSAEGTLERRSCAKTLAKDEGIYSRAALCATPPGGGSTPSKEDENSKEALRFIKEKYDSLGKVKVKRPSLPAEVEQGPLDESNVVAAALPVSIPVPEVVRVGEVESPRSLPEVEASRCSPAIEVLRPSLVVEGSRSSLAPEGSRSSGQGQGQARSSSSISEQELAQVEMFYRSHKTSVFVCLCQATLYLSDPIRNSLCPPRVPDFEEEETVCRTSSMLDNWTLVKSGIPVLVLDSGESRRQRRLNLVLAERGTGFGLWRDQIDCLSNYASPTSSFHTMHLSNDHTKLIGLRFADPGAAADFHQHIRCLTLDASDPLLSLASTSADDRKAKKAKAGSKRQTKVKGPAVSKADISQPCCFTHITKLDQNDGSNLLRGQSSSSLTDFNPRNSPRPGSGSGDRHKVKLKP